LYDEENENAQLPVLARLPNTRWAERVYRAIEWLTCDRFAVAALKQTAQRILGVPRARRAQKLSLTPGGLGDSRFAVPTKASGTKQASGVL